MIGPIPGTVNQTAHLVVLPGSGPDLLLKAIDVLAKPGNLVQQKAGQLADRIRQIQVRIAKRRRQTLDMNRALGSNDAELRQMAAKRIDCLGPLAHQEIARAEQHAPGLLLDSLHCHKLIVGRDAASQIASPSAASCFCRLT